MIVHLVCSAEAALRLKTAAEQEPSMQGEVISLPDRLHHGPLHRAEGQSSAQVRETYWRAIRHYAEGENPEEARTEEKLLEASNLLQKFPEAQLWFWMAPHAADVTAYYRSLRYLSKHAGRLFIINIAGLPFLDDAGKLFFPKSFDEVPVKELIKARKLARPITPTELELDGEVWAQIAGKESFYRFLQGGKKITTEEESYFDRELVLPLPNGPVKAARLVSNLVQKQGLPTDEEALLYRIKKLAAEGQLILKGDLQKSPREWELSLQKFAEDASSVLSTENENAG